LKENVKPAFFLKIDPEFAQKIMVRIGFSKSAGKPLLE